MHAIGGVIGALILIWAIWALAVSVHQELKAAAARSAGARQSCSSAWRTCCSSLKVQLFSLVAMGASSVCGMCYLHFFAGQLIGRAVAIAFGPAIMSAGAMGT